MDSFSVYLPLDRRFALAGGDQVPENAVGAVLFTDISGFTTLSETIANQLGFQRGAEEVSQYLDKVFGVLIPEVIRYHGSVISSGGDALLSWFEGSEQDAAKRAVTAAFEMQKAIVAIPTVFLPDHNAVQLNIKSAVACGHVRRFQIGDPKIRRSEVMTGSPLDNVGMAEQMARRGEVVVSAETAAALGNEVIISEHRQARDGSSVAVLSGIRQKSDPRPWGQIPSLPREQVQPWLHPFIFEYINSGQEMFMAQLRPSVALFLHFAGINYEQDADAGPKLDAFFRWVQKRVDYYGGTIIDLVTGDKGNYVYIAIGTPYAHEDDSARAVGLAQSLLALSPELDFIHDLQIGISRGTIWSGSIGGRRVADVLLPPAMK